MNVAWASHPSSSETLAKPSRIGFMTDVSFGNYWLFGAPGPPATCADRTANR